MDTTTLESLRRQMAEAQLRCESANVPLYQSFYAQAVRDASQSASQGVSQSASQGVSQSASQGVSPEAREAQGVAALERALAGTLDAVCARVRAQGDEALQAAFPACASREAQLQTCASWLSAARCEGPANADFAAAHPQLCATASRNGMMLR
jgi:hypothetical protein